ncbi:hypothetical protein ACJD0Z_04725 [Flavobacteriaceae bacterium M23B6Z8]
MPEKYIHKLGKIAELLAGISFGLGTILLLIAIAIIEIREEIIVIGLYYVIAAIVINLLYFLTLLVCMLFVSNRFRVYLLLKALLLLCNIPVVFIYIWTLVNVLEDGPGI